MKILGVDYGRKKIGLAMAEGPLAEPFLVLRGENPEELGKKIGQIVEKEAIDKIVVGISEGEMAKETKAFGESLRGELNIPLEFYDETLTSKDAIRLSVEAGVKRQKRKSFEDAFAATLMLQSYLERSQNV